MSSNNSAKDERLHQFERNRYFYGKLMTVSDFESEQTYYNDKRHLINRTIHGEGILCGLHVRNLQKDWSVELSPGIALDCIGQEIVVGRKERRLVSIDKVNPAQNSLSSEIGIFISRKDEGKDPIPQTSSNEHTLCTDSKIQENFELYLDLLSDETSLVSSDECPSCKGKEPGVLLSVLRKSSQGWEIDHMGTLQQRKIVSSWFNYRGIETSQPTESKNLTTGLIEIDFSKGTNVLYGPIKHYIKNIKTPPFVTLAKAADSTTVEYMEDYGLCNLENNSISSSTICFKAVNINLDTFMIRIDSTYSGRIILRYWANAARDTGKQHASKLVKPTLQFSSQKYSLEDIATITVTDPTMDRTTDVDSIQIKVSVPNTQAKTYPAKETGLRSGVFNVQIPISEIATSAPDILTATYLPKNLSQVTEQVEIVHTEKPQISFTSNSYRIGDQAVVKIIDNTKGPADILMIQVVGSADSTTRQYYAKHVIKTIEGTIFKAIFNVADVVLNEPDTITVVYKYQLGVGDTVREVKATAKIGSE